MKKFLFDLLGAFCAGAMIAIGAIVYLSCESKVVGAFLFAVGLMAICQFGMNLFTGKIGYTVYKGDSVIKKIGFMLTVWIGNFIGTLSFGSLFALTKGAVVEKARTLCENKLASGFILPLILGIFCGILMFIAVDVYKRNEGIAKFLGIFICVPVFILSGFEHSIADMAYFALCGKLLSPAALLFLFAVTVGNTVGGMIIPAYLRITKSL